MIETSLPPGAPAVRCSSSATKQPKNVTNAGVCGVAETEAHDQKERGRHDQQTDPLFDHDFNADWPDLARLRLSR